ncbi:MAG: thioesterase family protein [Halieaceae bacterium]|uniref:acyl-CoA thioesterase n=1 Tax=Haliea alexandrii TaxID=2448162 RepID=UPI000F0B7C44|nr:acyl-CoA thioesterase domain-containing protein [Haliea alexandrii]MCR9186557.1 thioesterase family protein [Halieaceae bacterium]
MLDQLLQVLTPRFVSEDVFIADNMHPRAPRVFGGQVLAQALRAAAATVPVERAVHSQHAYFLRPGDPAESIRLEVDRALDGGSLSSRRVVALQRGKPILVSSVSFQTTGASADYQRTAPEVPPPESLISERQKALETGDFDDAFPLVTGEDLDVRMITVVDWHNPRPLPPVLSAWVKTNGCLNEPDAVHASLLAYFSDTLLIDVCLAATGRSYLRDDIQLASLDHALWFHGPIRADEWLLHTVEAERVAAGRGLAHGRFYNREGVLVASASQQGLMRAR